MTNLQKLTELLCEVKEIKEDIMEVKYFWSFLLETKDWLCNRVFINYKWYKNEDEFIWMCIWELDKQFQNYTLIYKQIWFENKSIEERHIRMYSYNKNLWITIYDDWFVYKWWDEKYITRLDNTKDFDKQSEEVLWALVEYLSNIK